MENEFAHRRPPANVMFNMHRKDAELQASFARARRNDPCPWGSGIKFKKCHGRHQPTGI